MLGKNLITAATGAGAAGEGLGVEDVFSTWLYTGNGSTQTITNGIDLAGEGGLVWIKARNTGTMGHIFTDTVRGVGKAIFSNLANAQDTNSQFGYLDLFNADGFRVTQGSTNADRVNSSSFNYASWTFRKAEKFFDVVTFTSTGSTGIDIPHSLGSTPGCIFLKSTNLSDDWLVYHTSIGLGKALKLNLTNAVATQANYWVDVSSTSFRSDFANGSPSGTTWVAYLFAHDAGGFGDSGNESVVKCGSYTGNGSNTGPVIDLGWEPQWLLVKPSSTTGNWRLADNMRGMAVGGADPELYPNLADAENSNIWVDLLPTGFQIRSSNIAWNGSGDTYIYIAIRRGPMKTPTDATEVFNARLQWSNIETWSNGFPLDFFWAAVRAGNINNFLTYSRLTGGNKWLTTSSTNAEATAGGMPLEYDLQNSAKYILTNTLVTYSLRRAPGFFDVVAYTGTGSAQNISHNLGVVPELIIAKARTDTKNWMVYSSNLGATKFVLLNLQNAESSFSGIWNDTAPTSSYFTVGSDSNINGSGYANIAYLFATCPGVSKVGSYTGTGTTLQIDCGFASGARFVLIKRTDSAGDWYIWDTARGIVSGNDSYLLLNSTAAEVTGTDYIDPYAAGFEISSSAPAAINASGGSFIFLAIA